MSRYLIFIAASLISLNIYAETAMIIGDFGKDNQGQALVAESITDICQDLQCSFGITVGDNVYQEGITSPTDPRMDLMFKKYYGHLPFPFWISLGNHDYGKYSNDWKRGEHQVAYSKLNPQFKLPSEYYVFESDNAVWAVLDTSRLMWSKDVSEQREMVRKAEAQAHRQGKWFLVIGHHPYLSNGKHGNAGNYEGIGFPPMVAGTEVKKFLKNHVCGRAAVYFSGHDHSLQVLDGNQASCDSLLVVSGSGASFSKWREKNTLMFGELTLGFFTAEVLPSQIKIKAFNEKREEIYFTSVDRKKQRKRVRQGL